MRKTPRIPAIIANALREELTPQDARAIARKWIESSKNDIASAASLMDVLSNLPERQPAELESDLRTLVESSPELADLLRRVLAEMQARQ
jgi:hypothetical protein